MPSFAPQPLAPDARKRAWEVGLPAYLQHDLDAYKKGLAENSTLLDCLWGELYGSINGAEINYADFLAASDDPDLAAARARIVPRIDPAAFARLVAETPYLTDLQREFYTAYFAARAEKLFHVHPRN